MRIMLNNEYGRLKKCLSDVRKKTDFSPEIAIVLGSGLGALADEIKQVAAVDYGEIEGFPVSTAIGHRGRFVFGYCADMPVVIMQGRVHYYEGYSMRDVVLPTRLMGLLGAKKVFLTNAAGGINGSFSTGDLMLITGHIGCFVPSPLIGQNVDELGTRFPDMTEVYDKELSEIIRQTAVGLDIGLKEGTYCQLGGPNFETPQEIKMLSLLGADAVGMSTACEAVAARHMGLKVCGISCISNMAAGMAGKPLTHEDVTEAADIAGHAFRKLITASIAHLK